MSDADVLGLDSMAIFFHSLIRVRIVHTHVNYSYQFAFALNARHFYNK